MARAYTKYSDMDDFFDMGIQDDSAKMVAPSKEIDKNTPEYEYIETCFLDFKDVYKLDIIPRENNIFDLSIKINELKSSTFNSYKEHYNNISENMNNIDESLLRVRLKYPHTNINVSINNKTINLTIEI